MHLFTAASLATTAAQSDNGLAAATSAGYNDGRTIARAILAHLPTASHAAFYAFNNVNDTFTQFDNFPDFAQQCIEAETFGYIPDTENLVYHVLDTMQF